MSFSLNKFRTLFSGQNSTSAYANKQRQSVSLEPEIGFQIFIESTPLASDGIEGEKSVPELNVVLIAARHLPTVFGFKIVHGYNIKVKLFPGSKRFDSSIKSNSWPKFNESFKFSLAPDIKPSLKNRLKSKTSPEFLPEELFAGHFVVFTVYALLELPPTSFNRFNKTYRSLKERSSSLLQKVVDSNSSPKDEDDVMQLKPEKSKPNIPATTTSELKRNLGSVTCYLEPKVFKRNAKTGQFCTEEIWLPIKDINKTVSTDLNTVSNATKGIIEIILAVQDTLKNDVTSTQNQDCDSQGSKRQWTGFSEVKRRLNISNSKLEKGIGLRVTTSRMRFSNKVKDELEGSAGSVYIKTTVFEHNVYSDSWKSSFFFPSLSIKWDNEVSTLIIPIKQYEDLKHIVIKSTLATKNKIGKKIILGTVIIGSTAQGTGLEHWQILDGSQNEAVPMWHSFQ